MVEGQEEIDRIMSAGDMSSDPSFDQNRFIEFFSQNERAEYERAELSDRTLRRVARLLTPVQRTRFPSLAALNDEMNAAVVVEPSE